MSILTAPPPPPRRSRARLFIALGAVLLAAVASFAGYRAFFRRFSPFDSPEGRALGRKVPDLLIEAQDGLRAGQAPEAQKQRVEAAFDRDDREALGPDVYAKLETVLKTSVDVEDANQPSEELSKRFASEGAALNQALEARRLPYYIDVSIIRSRRASFPIFYSYYIENEGSLTSAGKAVRSLFVRRLDDLNFAKAALGYTKSGSTAAIVVLDHIESQLIDFVLPAAAGAEEPLLLDIESIDPESAWQSDLRAKSAAVVKSAYSDVTGESAAAVERVGKLFNRRRTLVRSWMKALDKQRFELHIPRRFIPEADYATDLMGHVPITELREWRAIHEELQEKPVLQAFDAIVLRQARSVEQHEAQHQIDFARDRTVIPSAVRELRGGSEGGDVDEFTRYVSGEVSAYLAEVARGPDAPALVVMMLSQSAFNRSEWGGAYCYAALAVMQGLGKELGAKPEPLVGGGRVDREALTRLLGAIAEKSAPDIRAAARRTWEAWFESALPDVTLEKTTPHPAWRR